MTRPVRALTLGEILRQTVRFLQRDSLLLLRIFGFFYIPVAFVIRLSIYRLAPDTAAIVLGNDGNLKLDTMDHVPHFWVVALVSHIGLLAFLVTFAAVVHAASQRRLGEDVTALGALIKGFRALPNILWGGVLFVFFLAVGLVHFFHAIQTLIKALFWWLFPYVVVIEGKSGHGALGQSEELMRGTRGVGVGLLLIILAMPLALSAVGGLFRDPHAAYVYRLAAQLFGVAFAAVSGTIFYYSTLCLRESVGLIPPANLDAQHEPQKQR